MSLPFGRKNLIIGLPLALAVCILFCIVIVINNSVSANSRVAVRNAQDSILLLVELAAEAGPDYKEANLFFAELLATYSGQMERRESLNTRLGALFSSNKNIAKQLKRIAADLETASETNEPNEIGRAKTFIAKFLTDSQLFKSKPIVPLQPDDIPPIVLESIRMSLDEAVKTAQKYSTNKNRTFDDAWAVCMANRKAIIYLYLIRFWYEDIINEEKLREFRSEINRTIYYNSVLQETLAPVSSLYRLLDEYSASETRRLRLLQAIIDKDFEQAQVLLQIALIEADIPL